MHIKENLNIFDFQLNESDTRALRGIKSKDRLIKYDPAKDHPFYPFEREEDKEEEEAPTPRRSSAAAKGKRQTMLPEPGDQEGDEGDE